MSTKKIQELLRRNEVTQEDFLKDTYNCLIVSVFEALIDEMLEDINFRTKIQNRLRNSDNPTLSVRNIVNESIGCALNDEESSQVYNYLVAYFRKKNQRYPYDYSVRIKKIEEQNRQCNICGRTISVETSELDHIIPWALVGDELGETNLQMLCTNCNRRKSKSVTYNLKMFLINKQSL